MALVYHSEEYTLDLYFWTPLKPVKTSYSEDENGRSKYSLCETAFVAPTERRTSLEH